MNLANFGAVRRLLLVSAVLTLSPLVASAQIVERSQTWDSLIQSHPCNAGLNGRHTILTDAQSSSSIGGGGGSVRVFVECDGVDTWAIVSIGGGGGGSGDVVGPASATDNCIATFNSTTGKLIQCNSGMTIDDGGNVSLKNGGGYYDSTTNSGMYFPSSSITSFYAGTFDNIFALRKVGAGDFRVALDDGSRLGWVASGNSESGTIDTTLFRSAAGIVAFGDGSTGGGAVHLTPLASPPRTCDSTAEGDLYSDTSHAMCWCDGTTWQKLSGAGTCA